MKRISTLAIEWQMPSSLLVDALSGLGIHVDNPDTELTGQQFDMLCDDLSKDDRKEYPNPADAIIDTINKLGPLTARMSAYERLVKIHEVYTQLDDNFSIISNPEKVDAERKVILFKKYAWFNFEEIQESYLQTVIDRHSDLQIKHGKDNNGKHYIDVTIAPYEICLEYNWNQEIWMSIQHIIVDQNNEERPYPIFPNADILMSLIILNLKFVKGKYVIGSSIESWIQTIDEILSNIRMNKGTLSSVLDNSTKRFPDGTMKVKRKVWKSTALLVDIHQESEKGLIQGIKKAEQPFYDNTPYLYGSNGTYVGPEEKYFVLKYKVLRPRQESFYSENRYTYIEKFIREQYLPKIQRERMSANLLEIINKKLSGIKMNVVTRDFDQYGAVSINATYLPLGFESWEEFLKTII